MLQSITLDNIMQGLFLGTIFAVLTVAYNKIIIGRFVKALIKAEAVHPGFAKSIEQLNMKKIFPLTFALRRKGMLRKFVFEPEDDDKKGYFYIPEDKLYRAGRIYGGKDVDILMVAAIIIILFIFFALALMYVPVLVDQVTNIAKNIIPESGVGK